VRLSSLLVSAALLGLLSPIPLGLKSAAAGDGLASRNDVMPLKDVKPGMKGYGLTVFEGTKPDRFDVEIIGVLDNFRPRQDLILIKTMHPRLDIAKVVAGMSGSPIYLNGKMIGAYAYGWTFGREPVAGVTPIRSMLDDLDRPLPNKIHGWPLRPMPGALKPEKPTAQLGSRFQGAPGEYDLRKHAAQMSNKHAALAASGAAPLAPVATPLLIGGMTGNAVGVAKELLAPMGLEPLQAGGGASAPEPNAPTRYVDGGAIGIQLIRGDMNAMGLGTVTRVEGDKLVGFGHPMNQGGVTALPSAVGRVLWFLASDMRSFKIGVPSRPLGALVNDRQASIVVSQSAQAPIIPVTMNIKGVPGAPYTNWKFDVAHEKFMTPAFVAIALGNALQATASERQDISWSAKSRLKVRGHGEIELNDFGVAIGGTPEAEEFVRSNLVRAVGTLLNNPWEPVLIESAHMDVELRFAREILRLRGAELLEPEIEAGQPARIRLILVPYAGSGVVQRVITVPIPAHLAGKTVNIDIAPGYTKQRDMAAPDTLAELVKNLEDVTFPPKSVVVSYETGDGAVSYKGHVATNLPPGAIDALRPTTSSIAPEPFGSEARIVVPVDQFMTGRDRVSVVVKPVLR
jgi:hypothetical protein